MIERDATVAFLNNKVAVLKKHAYNVCDCEKTHTAGDQSEYGYAAAVVGGIASDIQLGMHHNDPTTPSLPEPETAPEAP